MGHGCRRFPYQRHQRAQRMGPGGDLCLHRRYVVPVRIPALFADQTPPAGAENPRHTAENAVQHGERRFVAKRGHGFKKPA